MLTGYYTSSPDLFTIYKTKATLIPVSSPHLQSLPFNKFL